MSNPLTNPKRTTLGERILITDNLGPFGGQVISAEEDLSEVVVATSEDDDEALGGRRGLKITVSQWPSEPERGTNVRVDQVVPWRGFVVTLTKI